jgi:flagellin
VRINPNTAAVNAYRNLVTSDIQLSKSVAKRSSGFRLNRAADDAAGLAKSESLRAEIRGKRQAIPDGQHAISFSQTAEGALSNVQSILQRIRELAIDAAHAAAPDGTAQAEISELLTEIDSIGSDTTVAGHIVFSDYSVPGSELTSHADAYSSDHLRTSVDLTLAQSDAFGMDISTVGDSVDADTAVATLDSAIDSVSDNRAQLRAAQNRIQNVIANLEVAVENLSALESRGLDAAVARKMMEFTRDQILVEVGTARPAEANQIRTPVLSPVQLDRTPDS